MPSNAFLENQKIIANVFIEDLGKLDMISWKGEMRLDLQIEEAESKR